MPHGDVRSVGAVLRRREMVCRGFFDLPEGRVLKACSSDKRHVVRRREMGSIVQAIGVHKIGGCAPKSFRLLIHFACKGRNTACHVFRQSVRHFIGRL